MYTSSPSISKWSIAAGAAFFGFLIPIVVLAYQDSTGWIKGTDYYTFFEVSDDTLCQNAFNRAESATEAAFTTKKNQCENAPTNGTAINSQESWRNNGTNTSTNTYSKANNCYCFNSAWPFSDHVCEVTKKITFECYQTLQSSSSMSSDISSIAMSSSSSSSDTSSAASSYMSSTPLIP